MAPSESYFIALAAHADECEADLATLLERLEQGSWTRFDQLVAERTLHKLLESAIGVAKHWCKAATGHASRDAQTAFQRLQDAGLIDTTTPWRKMIGLRNALVHDYLEIDPDVIKAMLSQRHYQQPLNLIRQGLKALSPPTL